MSRTAHLSLASGAALFASLVSGCDPGTAIAALSVQIIDPAGENPVADVASGMARFDVRQGDALLACDGRACEATIEDGDFELDVPILDSSALTTIQVHLEGGATPLIGAAPPFVIANEGLEGGDTPVRVVMGAPLSCRALTLDGIGVDPDPVRLGDPVEDIGVAVRRNLAAMLGGEGADGASSQIVLFDQVVMRTAFGEYASPLGAMRGVTVSDDQSLFAGESVLMYSRREGGPPALVAHPIAGADASSALVARGLSGAAVIGGNGSSNVTWINALGSDVGMSSLAAPRSDPAAAPLASAVLVVGGQAAGEPFGEWLADNADGVAFDGPVETRGGFLIPAPNGRSALLVGAVLADGTVGADTYLITGCPACVVGPGPIWADPRARAAGVQTGEVFWILGGEGSRAIDRVFWDDDTPRLERVDSLALEVARAGATAFAHAAGIVTVVGGRSDDGLRRDIELCFPEALDPI